MGFSNTINVRLAAQKDVQIEGGDFWEMKGFISDRDRFPSRRWDGGTKTWIIPDVSVEELQPLIEAQGWSVLAGEDEQLEAEIAAIERVQKQVRWHSVEIAIRQEQESSKAESYTFNSKSRDKAKAMAAAGCFSHALRYAQQPVESLAEPQVATLKTAVNRIEDDYGYMPLRDLVMRFAIKDPDTYDFDAPDAFAERVVPLSSVSLHGVPKRGEDYLLDLYRVELAEKEDIDSVFLPKVKLEKRFSPNGKLEPVVVLQVKE
jgi:hypothetical protein